MYDLNGNVALVTGAGGQSGLGRAIALRLVQEDLQPQRRKPAKRHHGDSTGSLQ